MRIEPSAVYQRYHTYMAGRGAVEPVSPKPENSANTDKVSISGKAAGRGEFDRQLQKLTGEVEAGASPGKLQALQEKIENGSYQVSSQDVANAMLGIQRY